MTYILIPVFLELAKILLTIHFLDPIYVKCVLICTRTTKRLAMVTAIFKNHNGSYRVINWHRIHKDEDELHFKRLPDLVHDFRAQSCSIVFYDKPKKNDKQPRKN